MTQCKNFDYKLRRDHRKNSIKTLKKIIHAFNG